MTDPLTPAELEELRERYRYGISQSSIDTRRLLDEVERLRGQLERYGADVQGYTVSRLRTENKRLREALLKCDTYCEHLHHAKEHLHESGEPCPVEELIHAALRESTQ